MLRKPFYDPTLSYEDNYEKGPFSDFATGEKFEQVGDPQHDFLGQKVYLPFGIPAGPLLNSKFVKGAFDQGFDIAVYKTVRADAFPCHPFPNVLSLDIEGDLTPEKLEKPVVANTDYKDPISITNSFGVPSRKPEVWQGDAKKAVSYAGKGQVMILSFMGTVRPDQTQDEFIADYVLAAKLAHETGAKILEANLSCPNIGNEGLVCYNLEVTEKVAKGIREVVGNTPLVLKVGFYKNDSDMEKLADIVNEYADDVAGINTLQATVVDAHGNQALPGPNRLRSGICGHCIKWAGLDFVKRMKTIRDKKGYKFSITGVGGVTSPEDYKEFRDAGADVVMSATGAMWNPKLAQEIKKSNR
jgi:dihydroorotate dehydrogenase (NAD+) catalytic subunit